MQKFIFFVVIASLFLSCTDKKKGKWQDDITSGLIHIASDEAFEPIIQTELEVFESIYPSAGIIPIYTTEKEAVDLLYADSVRLCIISRKLTASEKKKFADNKYFPVEWKIATDAVALIVHKSNPDSMLSVKDIEQILTGKVSKWNQLNPKNPLKGDINVVFDNTDSGCLRYMMDSVCKGAALSSNLFAQKKHAEVIDYVSKSPHALGIIGVNWVGNAADSTNMSFNEQVSVVAVSKLDFADGFNSYKPYQAYIATGDYPLRRSVYAVLNDPRGGLSSGFTSFLCSQRGQYIILKSGLVPETQPIRIIQTTKEF
jgi:phosphate transport system substrate-binding protein